MSKIIPKSDVPQHALEEAGPSALELLWPAPEPRGFFSFQYTFTELTMRDGRTQVSGRRVRLDDGRLSSETFEGELGAHAFVEAAQEAQERLLSQWARLMNPFAWLLPSPPRPRDEHE